jgi:hypothetical protein
MNTIKKVFLNFIGVYFLSFLSYSDISAQDSIRVKNRHDVPDTSVKDTTKLKGGALIDTINIKPPKNKETTDTLSFTPKKQDLLIAYQDEKNKMISDLEKDINGLKAKLSNSTSADKGNIAGLENKKNELKERLKNRTMDTKESERWMSDYSDLKARVDKLKEK